MTSGSHTFAEGGSTADSANDVPSLGRPSVRRLTARATGRVRVASLAVASLVASLALLGWQGGAAMADTAPDPGVPATVSADALPTWQVNGVVWSQVMVGNTVYVTGKFATARPPGVAVGGAGEIAVGNLFAYDIRTGNPVAGFSHTLNAQGLVLHVSEDGKRLYVGGDFTTVDGQVRGHVAAFDLATGALVPGFAPAIDGKVQAITTSGSWVYVGGGFFHVGDFYRQRLASLAAVNGGVSTAWAPTASTSDVRALLMSPDRSKVIVGGSFLTLSGVTANGMGAVDPINGAVLPWAANSVIKDYDNGGITSLTTDGTSVFGSGFAFGAGGTFEGSFSLNPADGSIQWVADCLGDTYSTFAGADVVYSVGHAHNCSVIGGFPDTNPRVRWQRALAMTKAPTQTITKADAYGWNFTGQAAPSLLQWYPGLEDGNASGQSQAAWSVVGTKDYISLGGEFPLVNNAFQQGLTRFATRALATNKARPRFDVLPAKVVATTATAVRPGVVRVSYGSAWDRDNETLKYDLFRDGTTTLVSSATLKTNFWTTPTVSTTDRNAPPGNHTYQVRVTDPLGNTNWTTVSNTVAVGTSTTGYANTVLADDPTAYWRLDEPSGPTAFDYTGAGYDATGGAGVSWNAAGGVGDGDAAVTLVGTATSILPTSNPGAAPAAAPDAFSLEGWFNTTSVTGGKIIGFGDKTNGSSSVVDRNLYMDNAGRVLFGVNPGVKKVLVSAQSFNDGQWHHVTATLGTQGQRLYVDGVLVGRDVSTTSAATGLLGQWVVGGDTLVGWTNAPSSKFFKGSLDDVAVYPSALSASAVRAHYVAAGRTPAATTAPSDTYGLAVTASKPSTYWRLGESAGTTAVDASGNQERGVYSGTTTFGRAGAVPGDTAVSFNGSNTTVGSAYNTTGPSTYSAEVWFQTTSTRGGKLLGFGDRLSGISTVVDRNLTVLNSGQLRFSVNNNGTSIDSPASYRDGQWHHAVIAQGPSGMRLYVDGAQVAANPQATSTSFAGFWRVGGDLTWGGSTSSYLSGVLDEVAVYPTALSIDDVRAHYRASGRTLPNLAPTAAFTTALAARTLSVDGTSSSDPDGPVASWSWAFGDGTAGTGSTVDHTYTSPGTYTVTLTVADAQGSTATTTRSVTVLNAAPTASFTTSVAKLAVSVDARQSTDPDGTLASYAWDFGDGVSATGATAAHTYADAGDHTVTLTVTDDDGATDTSTRVVTTTANAAPTAAFTSVVDVKTVSMDAGASSDADGTVASYAWDFGDGTTGSGRTTTHTYAADGDYVVKLVVKDNDGATGSLSRTVSTAPVNQKPVAAFTSAPAGDFTTSLNASGSSDPDGTIAGYGWDFGDSTTGTGRTTTHRYAAAGTYSVVLTVTDDGGATATTTRQVTVTGPFALDGFARTVASAWGTSEVGGVWSLQGGASLFSVTGGKAVMRNNTAGAGAATHLNSVSSLDTDLAVDMAVDKLPTGGGEFVSVTSRGTWSDAYRAKVQVTATGGVVLALVKVVANAETTLVSRSITGVTVAPGTSYTVRVQTWGTAPATVRAKVWQAGLTEPTDWAATATDSTPGLQVPGAVGLRTYLSGTATNAPVVMSFDNLVARPTGN